VTWTYREATVMGRSVFRITNPDTGEIREFPSFTSLVAGYDEDNVLLGRIARSLGPEVAQRWEDGDESLDLAAEVRTLRERLAAAEGTVGGYRQKLAEALNSGDGSCRR
jgi:hypothetical protein